MKIAIASDHAGKELKTFVADFLTLTNHCVIDFGIASDGVGPVDYPDYADVAASEVSLGRVDRGILICGTGIGMQIVANKFPNVRAALVYDELTTRMSRAHNDTNVLCLGARTTNYQRAVDFVKIWLGTEFEEGRHRIRIGKINAIQQRLLKTVG